MLPGDDAVLMTAIGPSGTAADSRVVLLDLRTGASHVVVSRAMHGRYVRSGGSEYLLYALSDGTVLAARFNLRRRQVTGHAFAAVSDVQVAVYNGAALFAVADNGTLAFVRGSSTNLQLVKWVDRTGVELGTIGPALTATGAAPQLTLSPDGRRVAFTRRTPANNNLWLMNTTSGQLERLTFGLNEDETPVWSPDGRSVAYASTRDNGLTSVYVKSVEGTSDPMRIYTARTHGHLSSWSPDGRSVVFTRYDGKAFELWRLDLENGREQALTTGGGVNLEPRISPDGKRIVYVSTEGSGHFNLKIADLSATGVPFDIRRAYVGRKRNSRLPVRYVRSKNRAASWYSGIALPSRTAVMSAAPAVVNSLRRRNRPVLIYSKVARGRRDARWVARSGSQWKGVRLRTNGSTSMPSCTAA
jgi:WD40 repeat protein